MQKLIQHLLPRRGPAVRPEPGAPIDHPEIRRMDLAMLADLPFPRPVPQMPAQGDRPAG